MARYIVLHLTLSEGMVLEINGRGWSSPCGSVYAGLTVHPKKEGLAEKVLGALALRMYRAVAEVEADSVASLFPMTNHIDHDWRENDGVIAARKDDVRSTCVGDLAVRAEDGHVFLCASFGWIEITDPITVDAVRLHAGDLHLDAA